MKVHIRTAGASTGPVDLSLERIPLVLTVIRAPDYIESVAVGDVEVDGADSTRSLADLFSRTPQSGQVKALFLNATTMAGFNVIDIEELSILIGIPVICIVRDEPRMKEVEHALKARFADWEERLEMLERSSFTILGGVHVAWAGADEPDVERLICTATVQGRIPEPLRVARMFASSLTDGVSKGRVN